MPDFKLRLWTGPTAVKEIAQKLREANVNVLCEGTECVHVMMHGGDEMGAAHNMLVDVYQKHGTDFGLMGPTHQAWARQASRRG